MRHLELKTESIKQVLQDYPSGRPGAGVVALLPEAEKAHLPSMVSNIASLLDGIYLEFSNRVDYAGVNAGSEIFQPMPCLFDASQLLGDGSTVRRGYPMFHHATLVGSPWMAT